MCWSGSHPDACPSPCCRFTLVAQSMAQPCLPRARLTFRSTGQVSPRGFLQAAGPCSAAGVHPSRPGPCATQPRQQVANRWAWGGIGIERLESLEHPVATACHASTRKRGTQGVQLAQGPRMGNPSARQPRRVSLPGFRAPFTLLFPTLLPTHASSSLTQTTNTPSPHHAHVHRQSVTPFSQAACTTPRRLRQAASATSTTLCWASWSC